MSRSHLSVRVSFVGTIRAWSLQGQGGEERRKSCEAVLRRKETEIDQSTKKKDNSSFIPITISLLIKIYHLIKI